MPGHTDIPAVAPTMMQPMAAPEVTESELEEGRNALRQVFQIIQVLIQQGLSEEQILEFLAQNGISEAELEEAAQVLGIDISTLFAGTARMPMAAGGMADPLAPAPVAQTPEMVIFSLQSQINNLMQDYDMAVRNDEFTRAQGIADQIDVLQQQIINLQDSKVPPMAGLNMRFGGSADVGSITPISPFEMTEAFGGPLYQMLNPGAQQLVDRFGLRGQGLSGAAAMALSPQKKVVGGLTALDNLTRRFLVKEKNRLEALIASIKKGTDSTLKKENLAIYQKQLDNINDEIAENIRLRKRYDEMVKDPSKF